MKIVNFIQYPNVDKINLPPTTSCEPSGQMQPCVINTVQSEGSFPPIGASVRLASAPKQIPSIVKSVVQSPRCNLLTNIYYMSKQ